MSYKTTIKCFSEKNTMAEYKNFSLYVDGISYPNTGRYFETDHPLKGKRHIYALVRGDFNKKVCSFLNNEHLNECVNQNREGVIEYLKDLMNGAQKLANAENSGEHSAAMIYVENGEIYVAGFGDAVVYAFSDDMKTAEKFEIGGETANAVYIGKVEQCNKYLLSASSAIDSVSSVMLRKFFSADTEKAMDTYDEVSEQNEGEHLVTASVSFEKEKWVLNTKIIIACVLILLLAVSGYLAAFKDMFGIRRDSGNNESVIQSEQSEEVDENRPDESDIEEAVIPELTQIEEALGKIAFEISGENSKVAYYIKNLTSGEVLSSNSSQMYSANTVNMYVMAEIYRQIQAGELSMDASLKSLLESSIVLNDFDSANELVKVAGNSDIALGFEKVTANAVNTGCINTVLRSELTAPEIALTLESNMTSVEDCALFLEKLYNGTVVSVESSAEMRDLMSKSTPRTKILKYIPETGVISFNKSGDAVNAQNDVALICTDKCDYIMSVMISDFSNTQEEAAEVVARMSKVVYEYLTEGNVKSDLQ